MHLRRYRFFAYSILLAGLVRTTIAAAAAPPISADAMLDIVIAQFPTKHIKAEGTMFVRQRRGIPRDTYRFTLDALWQANQTHVSYIIQDDNGIALEALTFRPYAQKPFSFRQGPDLEPAPMPAITSNIGRTDISWLDLSLYFLWWRGARHAGEDTVRGFHCYIIEAKAPEEAPPGTYASVRLWISSEQGLLIQAQGLDAQGRPIRRLWVQSVRQVDDQWIIQTLEVQQHNRNQRTRLQVIDVTAEQETTP